MRLKPRLVAYVLFVVLQATLPRLAHAQSDPPLSSVLVDLIGNGIRLDNEFHTAHFNPQLGATFAPFVFNQALISQLATLPIGSSAGGFAFDFDPESGTFDRSTQTFGSSFGERAVTIGRGRLSVGFRFMHRSFDRYDDKDLEDGSIDFILSHEDVPGDNHYEGDVVRAALKLDLSADTAAALVNYGVLDNLDVGLVVPIVSIDMNAQLDATVLRLATGNDPGTILHSFGGSDTGTLNRTNSVTGLGDVLVRTKYNFFEVPGGGLAAGLDLRLPTGDEQELLGTGATQAKFSLIGSNEFGNVGAHFNFGYTASANSDSTLEDLLLFNLSDELSYGAGIDAAVDERVTVFADVIGRTLFDAPVLNEVETPFFFRDSFGVQGTTVLRVLKTDIGNVNLILASIGVKVNLSNTVLISGDILFPLTSAGLTETVTPVIGLEYTF